ncbi:MAG TPA: hypothetical protein VN033_05940 [Vulgatibacter sp.]|nr:hypothetical protein [Vulgatibacter sp.]
MAAPKDFLTGFNHNVRHKGRGFHVQTEDSGEEIAHVITHLFEGGNILASKRTSYADLRGRPDLKSRVRSIMEEQHRQMLRELVNGAFDAPSAPAPPEPPPATPGPAPDGTGFLPPLRMPAAAAPAPAGEEIPEAPKNSAPVPRPAPQPGRPHPAPVLQRSFVPPPRPDRTPGPAPAPGSQQQVLWPTADEAARLASAGEGQVPVAPVPTPARPAGADPTPGPANWRPVAPIETVFGEEPGAEKSLDEVILRYLAGERD